MLGATAGAIATTPCVLCAVWRSSVFKLNAWQIARRALVNAEKFRWNKKKKGELNFHGWNVQLVVKLSTCPHQRLTENQHAATTNREERRSWYPVEPLLLLGGCVTCVREINGVSEFASLYSLIGSALMRGHSVNALLLYKVLEK
ncbi:hypothetical protein KQX54_018074 [Cotesia glomerata]|uniref:Uncharacterized protein n=1 Tax=Cotesia glomerata TaxID=32391 RepID=A0AAV7HZ80_COTGL|nr:hypothetical protein KQX54_018074 [Cotesia glomerata]